MTRKQVPNKQKKTVFREHIKKILEEGEENVVITIKRSTTKAKKEQKSWIGSRIHISP